MVRSSAELPATALQSGGRSSCMRASIITSLTKPAQLIADRFEIERLAGAGGMGVVYRAIDRQTGRPVALKVLARLEPASLGRFSEEARILAEMDHPAIVRYVAHGRTPAGQYL